MNAPDEPMTGITLRCDNGNYAGGRITTDDGTRLDGVKRFDIALEAGGNAQATVTFEAARFVVRVEQPDYVVETARVAIPMPDGLTPRQVRRIAEAIGAAFDTYDQELQALHALIERSHG